MTTKQQAIILGSVRHSDRATVVNVYTRSHGYMSLLVAVGGNAAKRRAATLMPLAQVEFESRTSGAELVRPTGLTIAHAYRTLYFDPVKTALVYFLTDFLGRLMRQNAPDAAAYDYICRSLHWLDSATGPVANFHLAFLTGMASLMGIAPDTEGYRPGLLFDLRGGTYSAIHPGHNDILPGESAAIPKLLERLTFANMHRLRLSREERAATLRGILRYWGIHFPGTASLKSLDVLETLFD